MLPSSGRRRQGVRGRDRRGRPRRRRAELVGPEFSPRLFLRGEHACSTPHHEGTFKNNAPNGDDDRAFARAGAVASGDAAQALAAACAAAARLRKEGRAALALPVLVKAVAAARAARRAKKAALKTGQHRLLLATAADALADAHAAAGDLAKVGDAAELALAEFDAAGRPGRTFALPSRDAAAASTPPRRRLDAAAPPPRRLRGRPDPQVDGFNEKRLGKMPADDPALEKAQAASRRVRTQAGGCAAGWGAAAARLGDETVAVNAYSSAARIVLRRIAATPRLRRAVLSRRRRGCGAVLPRCDALAGYESRAAATRTFGRDRGSQVPRRVEPLRERGRLPAGGPVRARGGEGADRRRRGQRV